MAEDKRKQLTSQSQPPLHMHHHSLGAQDVVGVEPSHAMNPVVKDKPVTLQDQDSQEDPDSGTSNPVPRLTENSLQAKDRGIEASLMI